MVRIAHISDSHLGSSLFQLTERREDARKCLKKSIEMAMRHSPDLLVHTGDLYHTPLPQNDDQIFVIELLKNLKDKIPVVILDGNHDIPYGYRYNFSPLRSLETMELIKSTGAGPYTTITESFDGKEVDLHLVSWTGHSQFDHFLQESIKSNGGISLFFAHDIPVEKENLPVHHNYYGCGHKHNFWLDEEFDIGRPGSTCLVNWKREMAGKKKLIIIDIDKSGQNEYTTENLNDVREFKFIPALNITGMGTDEANQTVSNSLSRLSPKKKKPIIIVEVNGLIDAETERGIERKELIEFGEKKLDPLFLHIEPNWECYGPRDIKLTEPLNVEKSIHEYLTQTKDKMSQEVLELLPKLIGSELT